MSVMVKMPKFNIIKAYTIDYMHNVCLGVVKKIISIWTDKKNRPQPYFLTEEKINAIDKYLTKIKPCSFITRRPRSLRDFPSYKACEARAFLLYYFFPIFSFLKIQSSKYVAHMEILSSTIYNLLRTKITEEMMNDAEENLKWFVSQYEILYTKENVVMNLHLLIHMTETVRQWGPLWAQSAFPYETMNGVINKYVNGPVQAVHQIITKYTISKSLNIRKENNVINMRNGEIPTYSFRPDEEAALLSRNYVPSELRVFGRYKCGSNIYTSLVYKEVKYADYFVLLEVSKVDKIGKIRLYFCGNEDQQVHFIFEEYYVRKSQHQFQFVESKKTLSIHSISTIRTKLIYVRSETPFSSQTVIIRRPNHIETD